VTIPFPWLLSALSFLHVCKVIVRESRVSAVLSLETCSYAIES